MGGTARWIGDIGLVGNKHARMTIQIRLARSREQYGERIARAAKIIIINHIYYY